MAEIDIFRSLERWAHFDSAVRFVLQSTLPYHLFTPKSVIYIQEFNSYLFMCPILLPPQNRMEIAKSIASHIRLPLISLKDLMRVNETHRTLILGATIKTHDTILHAY